jgi:hypothetical protein
VDVRKSVAFSNLLIAELGKGVVLKTTPFFDFVKTLGKASLAVLAPLDLIIPSNSRVCLKEAFG